MRWSTWASWYWRAGRVEMVMPTMEMATKVVETTEIHLAATLGRRAGRAGHTSYACQQQFSKAAKAALKLLKASTKHPHTLTLLGYPLINIPFDSKVLFIPTQVSPSPGLAIPLSAPPTPGIELRTTNTKLW